MILTLSVQLEPQLLGLEISMTLPNNHPALLLPILLILMANSIKTPVMDSSLDYEVAKWL